MRIRLLTAAALCMLCSFSAPASAPATAANEEPVLSFPVVSDVHVQDNEPAMGNKLAKALRDLNELNPNSDAFVLNGDLGNGLPEDYKALGTLLGKLPHPQNFFFTIGNHEFYKSWVTPQGYWSEKTFPNGETEQASIQRYLSFTGLDNVYYDRWVKDYHFIFLGSERYRQGEDSIGEDAWLSEAQFQWLSAKLKEREEPNKPIFLFLHQPLPNTVAGSQLARGVVQHERLKQILDEYPQVFLFTGHTHWRLNSPNTLVRQNFTMINSSSVSEPYNTEDQPVGGPISEGLYVQVYRDVVMIKGRDFSKKEWIPSAQFLVPLPKAVPFGP